MRIENTTWEAESKRQAWIRVQVNLTKAWQELNSVNESPMMQANLLTLLERAVCQERLWENEKVVR